MNLATPPVAPPRIPSSVEPFASLVEQWVEDDVEMRAMHRLLCEEHGFTGSYTAVRRFVAAQHPVSKGGCLYALKRGQVKSAQVDFGTVGKLFDPIKVETAHSILLRNDAVALTPHVR